MRRLFRIFLFLLVLILALFAIRAYNTNKYAVEGESYRDRATVLAAGDATAVDGTYLSGVHFAPTTQTKSGTVVMFGGSEGGIPVEEARALRDQGYNVLALYFFGQPNQQQDLAEVPLDFFDEAISWIEANTSPGPLTVIGRSKGAELTANLAARYPQINNFVVYTPSEYNYFGLKFSRESFPSATWQGQPVPFIPMGMSGKASGEQFLRMALGLPISYRASYVESVENATNTEEARIDLSGFQGNGLLFAGDKDAMWQGEIAAANLASQNPNLEAVIYPDAGHAFAEDITSFGPSWEVMLGGTVEGNRAAKTQSDALLFERLAEWHGPIETGSG